MRRACWRGAEAADRKRAAVPLLEEWPPEGSTQLDISDLYARLRRGDEITGRHYRD